MRYNDKLNRTYYSSGRNYNFSGSNYDNPPERASRKFSYVVLGGIAIAVVYNVVRYFF